MSLHVLAISYFFHLIATVLWVGGLLLLAVLVLPEVRRTVDSQLGTHRLLSRLRKRFLPLTHFSLVVLVVTGLVQMSGDPNYEGVLQVNNAWSWAILLKHIAVVGMFVCGLVLQFGVVPALDRIGMLLERDKPIDAAELTRLHQREMRLTWINVGLGVLTLAFTAWATAI